MCSNTAVAEVTAGKSAPHHETMQALEGQKGQSTPPWSRSSIYTSNT